ncbi:MAG: hypothetical protein HUK18_06015 [Bacteroidales bacterium]|nr:hypothetical protein [Bacteroidales bacterium]
MAKKTAKYENYVINVEEDGSISVYKDGIMLSNSIEALRQIADEVDFSYDTGWNTRHFGSKLIDFINAHPKKKEDKKGCLFAPIVILAIISVALLGLLL